MRRTKPQLEPTVQTGRLKLRPLRQSDLDDIVAGIGELAVSRMLARVPHPYTQAHAEAFFASATRNVQAGSGLFLIVERDGRLVGGIGIEAMPYTCEFGYWLSRPNWGMGLATEAATAILAYAFAVLDLRLVRSGYFSENEGSRRVQQKLGFRQIGVRAVPSLARGAAVPHIDTVLTPSRFRQAVR